VRDFILPRLDLYTKKISCNPHNLLELFTKAAGFTGTLWNSKSMHRKMTAEPEAGTDAQTINLLWEYSRDEVYVIEEGSPDHMFQQIHETNIPYDMISDAGGYFKEGGNKKIAELMSAYKKQPVVFYNKKNEQALLSHGNESLLQESSTAVDQRATFLDQSHTTGADVTQKRDAVGIVTISRNMLLRDLLQSSWRLRGLAQSQRVKFVITKEVEAIIRQATGNAHGQIRFDDILRFVMINQTKQQGKDNFKALRQELANIPQSILMRVLVNKAISLEQKKKTFEFLSEEWIKDSCKRPGAVYGALTYKEHSQKVLDDERQRYMDRIDEIFKELPFLEASGISLEKEKDAVDAIIHRLEAFLQERLPVPLRDMDDDQTVEIEQETQTETETELEVQEHQETKRVSLGEIYSVNLIFHKELTPEIFNPGLALPYFSLKTYLEQDEKLKQFADAFEGIALTLNVLEWPKKDARIIDLKLLGAHRTPFHFVKEDEEGRVIILNQHDASMSVDDLYNLTLGYYDKEKPVSDAFLRKVVKIKFLNGDSSFTKKEIAFLREWIEEQGPEEMLAFYQQHILAGFPEKAAAYCQSNLKDLFGELLKSA